MTILPSLHSLTYFNNTNSNKQWRGSPSTNQSSAFFSYAKPIILPESPMTPKSLENTPELKNNLLFQASLMSQLAVITTEIADG